MALGPILEDGVKSAAQYQPRANPGLWTGESRRVDFPRWFLPYFSRLDIFLNTIFAIWDF